MIYEQYEWDKKWKAWTGPNGLVEKSYGKFRWYASAILDVPQVTGACDSWEEAVMALHPEGVGVGEDVDGTPADVNGPLSDIMDIR